MKIWKNISLIESIIYLLLSTLIFSRSVDGAGAIQTPSAKLASWFVLDALFIILLIGQITWLVCLKRKN
ncbi:DUF3923 family protein [Fructilactobacillus vespulae]|uniref:DUF3923 family protein n=1 Tax=Fructilactobacillus vespulae TaxID=1249630 RepID=UPI0039B40CB9